MKKAWRNKRANERGKERAKRNQTFSAHVRLVDGKRRVLLTDVWDIGKNRIFREHTWVKWKTNDRPNVGENIVFHARIVWYTKVSGKRMRGLVRPKLQRKEDLT